MLAKSAYFLDNDVEASDVNVYMDDDDVYVKQCTSINRVPKRETGPVDNTLRIPLFLTTHH